MLVMQRFLVVYHGISHESIVSSSYTQEPLGECVYQENTSDNWDIPWYTRRRTILSILRHAIENTEVNINECNKRADFILNALNWLPIIYDLDNVYKALSKCLLNEIHDTEYKECMSNIVVIINRLQN